MQMASAMRPPSAGIEDYLKALNKKPEGQSAAPAAPAPSMQQLIGGEMQKLQQLQMQRQQAQQQLQMIESQILKVQGGVEVLKRMAGIP